MERSIGDQSDAIIYNAGLPQLQRYREEVLYDWVACAARTDEFAIDYRSRHGHSDSFDRIAQRRLPGSSHGSVVFVLIKLTPFHLAGRKTPKSMWRSPRSNLKADRGRAYNHVKDE